MSSLIEFENVTRTFIMGDNRVDALKGVSFRIDDGELCAVIGPSGSGKSTIMNIVGLLDRHTSGKYYLEGESVKARGEDELARLRNHFIGFVFQSFFLLPRLTALQNVCLPILYRGESQSEYLDRAEELLSKVGMGTHMQHRPHELSGGQQQRVAIARALMGKPSLLLADEPTGALDSKTSQEVMDLFKSLNSDDGVTVMIITHDPRIADQCPRVIKVLDGNIESDNG